MSVVALEAAKAVAKSALEQAAKKVEGAKDTVKEIADDPEKGLKELGEKVKETVTPDIDAIKNMSLDTLKEEVKQTVEDIKTGDLFRELSDEEKKKIKEETGWSDEIIDAIGSWKEYEIYKKAGLKEAEVNGKKCLVRDDIDWDQKDAEGRTNRERVDGNPPLAPINKSGEKVELHHIGQHQDSPFAELTMQEHRSKENYSILHDTSKEESEIDRNQFNKEKKEYWQARAAEGVD